MSGIESWAKTGGGRKPGRRFGPWLGGPRAPGRAGGGAWLPAAGLAASLQAAPSRPASPEAEPPARAVRPARAVPPATAELAAGLASVRGAASPFSPGLVSVPGSAARLLWTSAVLASAASQPSPRDRAPGLA